MNPEQVRFIQSWDGPANEAYFAGLMELGRTTTEVDQEGPVDPIEPEIPGSTGPWLRDWDEPVPLSSVTDPPTFPTGAFPKWLRDYVEAEALAVQVPLDMPAMFVLGAIAGVAAGRVEIEPVEGWREGVNVYMVVAMDPGSRKSAAHRDVMAPVVEFERLLVETARPDVAQEATIRRIAEQALARAEKAAAGAKDEETRHSREDDARKAAAALERLEVPNAPRLFTSDATPEALATLLHQNGGRMAVISAEAGVFGVMSGRYAQGGPPNLDVYLAGHAGDPIRVDRRGRAPEFVNHPSLTVCLACQPFVLRQAGQVADLTGRGLLDRFLYALPHGNVGYRQVDPPPVPRAVRQRYDTSIRALAAASESRRDPLVLNLTADAARLLSTWRASLEPRRRPDGDLGGVVQGWSSKLDGATVRIAGLVHLATTVDDRADVPIDAATMSAAIEIAGYLIPHARAAFDHMGTDRHLEAALRVLAWLQRHGRREFSKRDVHSALQSFIRRSSELDPVLRLLEDHGYIRPLPVATRPQGGRPSQRFTVHPRLQNRTQPTKPSGARSSVGSARSVHGSSASIEQGLKAPDPWFDQEGVRTNAPVPEPDQDRPKPPHWDA